MADPGEGPGARRGWGRAPPGPPPPPPPPPRAHLFLDQTEARRAEKFFFETAPPPAYLRVWMTAPPPLCEGLNQPLRCFLQ